jgi:hypothetical protein
MRNAQKSEFSTAVTAALSLIAAGLVSACGGSGSTASGSAVALDQSAPAVPAAPTTPTFDGPSAEGIWQGPMSLGWDTTALVLNSGQTYLIYSLNGVVQGMVDGHATSSAGSFSSTDALDFTPLPLRRSGATIRATYVAQQSLNGTVVATSGEFSHTDSFSATYQPAYGTEPTLALLAGTYSGSGATRSGTGKLSVTVDGSGQLTGTLMTPAEACSVTGAVTSRGNGRAILNVRLSLAGASCTLNGLAVEGAVSSLPLNAGSALYLSTLLLDRSNGLVAVIAKQ